MNDASSKKQAELSTGVKIGVEVTFIPEQSKIQSKLYCYSYKVEIHNNTDLNIKLINRHWKVFSGNKQIADVKGEGVVGEQPIIQPNTTYTYTSFTMIPSDYGYMYGSYTFQGNSGEFFDVDIPRFDLFRVSETSWH